MDFLLGPVVQNPSQTVNVTRRKRIGKEISRRDLDPVAYFGASDDFLCQRDDLLEIENDALHIGVAFAGSHDQMAGGAAHVDEPAKPAQVK